MTRKLISSGSQFERDIGYSRAVVDGKWVFVSGTTGFDYATMSISENLLEQADQCFKNIQAALREAGSDFADVVRVTYILPDAGRFSISQKQTFSTSTTYTKSRNCCPSR